MNEPLATKLRTLTTRRAALALAALVATAGPIRAQNPGFDEFRVNTYTTGAQRSASVAGSGAYRFVVAWECAGQDGSQYGVFAQRFEGSGTTPAGPEFQVNTYTTSSQSYPDVASDPNGNFVVVWQSDGQDGDGTGVFAQRYSAAGAPLGAEFRVNTFTTLAQGSADVAIITGGGFVVVWQSAGQDGSDYGIFGQRYSIDGAPVGAEFRVNTYTTGAQRAPAVASDLAGTFVVTWEGESADDELLGIRAQRYSPGGAPLGGEFRVNTYTTGNQRSPALAMLEGTGQVTIAWQSDGQDGSGDGVFAQRYGGAGSPAGPEFRVNTYTTSSQSSPAVNFGHPFIATILWQSDGQDGSSTGIYAQKFADGFPAGGETAVNITTPGPQSDPSMAYGGWPRWLSPWTSAQDPDGSPGIYAVTWWDLPVELQTLSVE